MGVCRGGLYDFRTFISSFHLNINFCLTEKKTMTKSLETFVHEISALRVIHRLRSSTFICENFHLIHLMDRRSVLGESESSRAIERKNSIMYETLQFSLS